MFHPPLQRGLYFRYFSCQQSGQRSAICIWARTFSTSESWPVIRWRIQLCLSICLKLDSILNAWSLDSLSIYAGTRRRSTTSCPNYPVPALSLNRYVRFSSDKQDKSYKALQEAGGVIPCLYVVTSPDRCRLHSLAWSVSALLCLLGRSRCLLLGRWGPNAPLHSLGDLDAMQSPRRRSYEPSMWLSICLRAYLLFCRACWQEWCNCWWLIFGCCTNVDSTWMKSEPWSFEKRGSFAHPPHKLRSSAVTSGKVWKGKLIKMTQHNVNEKHKQK